MRQIMDQLRIPGGMDPVAPLLYSAFVIAVRKAFAPEFTRGEVVRLVSNVRVLLGEMRDAVDPVAAETEIRRALGENIPAFPDANASAAAQMTVLGYLVRDLGLDGSALSDLLAQARSAADRFTGLEAPRSAEAGSDATLGSASVDYDAGGPRWVALAQDMLNAFRVADAERRADIEHLKAENRTLTARVHDLEARFEESNAQIEELRRRLGPKTEPDDGEHDQLLN